MCHRSLAGSVGADDVLGTVRTTQVVLAAYRNHDTSDNRAANLAAFASGVTCFTTRPSIGIGVGEPCSGGERWATYFVGPTAENTGH